jgi:hypothetical protein
MVFNSKTELSSVSQQNQRYLEKEISINKTQEMKDHVMQAKDLEVVSNAEKKDILQKTAIIQQKEIIMTIGPKEPMRTEEITDKVTEIKEDEIREDGINLTTQEIRLLKREEIEKEVHQTLHLNVDLREEESVLTRIHISETTREER